MRVSMLLRHASFLTLGTLISNITLICVLHVHSVAKPLHLRNIFLDDLQTVSSRRSCMQLN